MIIGIVVSVSIMLVCTVFITFVLYTPVDYVSPPLRRGKLKKI